MPGREGLAHLLLIIHIERVPLELLQQRVRVLSRLCVSKQANLLQ
jgi:hypothetical protein